MTTLLIVLSGNPEAASCGLQLDGSGSVVARFDLRPGQPPPEIFRRCVLAVPGDDTRSMWLNLAARSPAQAQAVAAIMVRKQLASAGDGLLVAVQSGVDPSSPSHMVVAVEHHVVRGWLDRAAALGVTPDAVVPDYLLLSAPDQPGVRVAIVDGRWLVRGEQLAFSADAALAKMVIGDRPVELIGDVRAVEQQLALAACSALPINLLQQAFTPGQPLARGWPTYRRSTMLFAMLALTPLLLAGVEALRFDFAARRVQAKALVVARTALPQLGPEANALDATRTRLADLQGADVFARSAGALFMAVQRIEGAQLESMSFALTTGLQATISHPAPADVEMLRAHVGESGFKLRQLGSQAAENGLRSEILLEPDP